MRLTKQIIYGSIVIVVLALIAWAVYSTFLSSSPSCVDGKKNQEETGVDCGGPCQSCDIKALQPVKANYAKVFRVADGVGVIVELYNPNSLWGAPSLPIELELKDAQANTVQVITYELYIHAGEVKYIIEPYIKDTQGAITAARVVIKNPQWISHEQFPRPDISVQDAKTIMDGSVAVAARVVNQTERAYTDIDAYAIVFNKNNEPLAGSKTIIDSLDQFAQRAFKISFSKDLRIYEPQADPSASLPRTLRVGDSGSDVKYLQMILFESGLLERDPTGFYDELTRESIFSMQQQAGLPATGELDEITRQAVIEVLKQQTPTVSAEQDNFLVDPLRTKIFIDAR
ncbi:MAG: peptidoglycan-binding protein [Candidatus Pacebacteria bacterium]|nr:peptidoglycan-binding protein [Candidatus Paceibacterota bacterium]